MKIEIHPNSNVEQKFSHLILSEKKNQVQTIKGRTISNFTEEEKKDGKITRSFEIKETSGRKIQFRWSVSCPFVAVFSKGKKGKEELVGFGFIADETYKHKLVSHDEFWTIGCDSCNAYCLECIRG
jgi:hypothetical protein